ncbi:MAG: hypothetical protein JXA81_06300 [Sedimentisphaerales bacterium]|nr:hypothetical protein [Sedimentisphaerales bacterium]
MSFKLTRGIFVTLILSCCGCQERQSNIASASSEVSGQQKDNPAASTVMVYYFHRKARCYTCLSIEASAAQVIRNNFRQQMADGTLIWMPFNLDDPGGDELEKKFDIAGSTLIVARTDDNSVQYKKLEGVWQLLGDDEGFSEYITDEINKFVNDK